MDVILSRTRREKERAGNVVPRRILRAAWQALPVLVMLGFMGSVQGCFRGMPSDKPPIHLNPNMDHQEKYLPQSESNFFANGSSMRLPVPGTVARGDLRDDDAYYRGMDANGKPIKKIPVPVTMQLLKRGQERFNIYCSPCHSRVGDGKGMVVKKGFLPPPSFHTDLLRSYPDGHVFDVISHGIRNMPAYGPQIPVADRWAIVAYFRALQRSQHAKIEDLPEEIRADYEVEFDD